MQYTVRHDNTFDNPDFWALTTYEAAATLRDELNRRLEFTDKTNQYHVDEEVEYSTATEVLIDLENAGFFEDCYLT